MDIFSLVEPNGQFVHLLVHTIFFGAKSSPINEIELSGKNLYPDVPEDLVYRGRGVGMSSWLCPLSVSQ